MKNKQEKTAISLIGKKIGRLTPIEVVIKHIDKKRVYCLCQCDCGNKKEIRVDALIYDWTKSCGCLHLDAITDELSPFRWHLQNARRRIIKKYGKSTVECNIDLVYLKKLWETQNGICPYTKIKMLLPQNSSPKHRKCVFPHQASLDRIDPTKGYIKGNVEFVCVSVNYAKNGFTKEEMINFFSQINISNCTEYTNIDFNVDGRTYPGNQKSVQKKKFSIKNT